MRGFRVAFGMQWDSGVASWLVDLSFIDSCANGSRQVGPGERLPQQMASRLKQLVLYYDVIGITGHENYVH